jgi:signal transduction histidine kinase
MFNFFFGIRKKIILGFFLLLFLMIISTILTVGILMDVQHKIINVEIIDGFLKKTLEARRFEKNYFLYKEEEDFNENLLFIKELENLFTENQQLLISVIAGDSLKRLRELLSNYSSSMKQLHQLNNEFVDSTNTQADQFRLEEMIRLNGQELVAIAEEATIKEWQAIRNLLETTGRVLLLSTFVLVVIGIVTATFLGHGIARSMKILEDHARKISKGEFVSATVNAKDEEINSLLKVFNLMTNELKARQKQLVQSEKLASLGTLLAGVAHELNNPLSNIVSSAQILAEEIEEADLELKKKLISQIVQQSERAGESVRSLLEFARTRKFNLEKVHIKKLVEEVSILVRAQAPSRIDIQVDIDPECTILADKQRLKQVFLNLTKNAIDVLGNDGHLWISAREIIKDENPLEIEIRIEDDGPGIPEETRSKIFDPFFTTKDVGHGSGLGLFIVHDIIEKHGGTIRSDSRLGEGTSFIILLPGNEGNPQ